MVMSLGEMDFIDLFTPNNPYYDTDMFIIFTVFLFIMPIVLMNLLVSPSPLLLHHHDDVIPDWCRCG
jgi:hypothetical protein